MFTKETPVEPEKDCFMPLFQKFLRILHRTVDMAITLTHSCQVFVGQTTSTTTISTTTTITTTTTTTITDP